MKVTCQDCDVRVINGVVCHEFGCPTARKEKEKQKACFECGYPRVDCGCDEERGNL